MPGKRITDHQVLTYKTKRRAHTQVAAAAKAGVSERSARRIESLESLPSQRPPRRWRTRPDPLVCVWEADLLPLLQTSPHLSAVTLLEELQRRHPGDYAPSTLRTLQRRLRHWRATHGRERSILRARPSARAPRTLRLHRRRRSGRDDRGHAISAQAVPVRAGAFGMAVCRRRRRRRKFYGALGWSSTRALALRRCSRGAPYRQPFSGVQEPFGFGTARVDEPVCGLMRALRDAPFS